MRTHGRLLTFLREYPGWASFVALAVGDCVLFGWRFDVDLLKSVVPKGPSINPMTALVLALSGLSLWLLRDGDRDLREPRIGRAFAMGVAVVCALRLVAYLAGWDHSIDTWVYTDKLEVISGVFQSRMAPSTALAGILLGASLALLDVKTRRRRRPSEALALGAVVVTLVAITGPFAMAWPAFAAQVALGVGVLCARPGEKLVVQDLLGFATTRRPDELSRRALTPSQGANS